MTQTEFFYWLQGYFELHGVLTQGTPSLCLTVVQAQCISRHAALVRATEAGRWPYSREFVRVEFLAEMLCDGGVIDEMTELTRKMQACVAEQFQHVIDPKAGDTPEIQAKLQEIHDGTKPVSHPWEKPLLRC
jgi:hypothetical protein